jgi:glutamate synthase domain-containing protein 3
MVEVERLEDAAEIAAVRALVTMHLDLTGSTRAAGLLQQWERVVPRFVKVMPRDYKRVLACIRRAHDQGLSGDEAIMVAFEENARDLARVGGN